MSRQQRFNVLANLCATLARACRNRSSNEFIVMLTDEINKHRVLLKQDSISTQEMECK